MRISGGKIGPVEKPAPQDGYRLSLNPTIRDLGKRYKISQVAVDQLRRAGKIIMSLESQGVRLGCGGLEPFPYINVRMINNGKYTYCWKVFLTESEISGLSRRFRLKPAEVNGAAFFSNGWREGDLNVNISPSLAELFPAGYHRQVALLVGDPVNAPLPDPPAIACRPIMVGPKAYFALPGRPEMFELKKAVPGLGDCLLTFDRADGLARAQYYAGETLLMTLRIDGSRIRQLEGCDVGQSRNAKANEIKPLFGVRWQKSEAVIERVAENSSIKLPSVRDLVLIIQPVVAGYRYWIRLVREKPDQLLISCYNDRELRHLHGSCSVGLVGGYPFQERINLTLFKRSAV
jgi:hypothetical protein